MIKFICDTCKYETDSVEKSRNNDEIFPSGWLSISCNSVHNDMSNVALTYAGNIDMHFCSKKCFVNKFFKPEEKPQRELTTAALKDCFEESRLTHPMIGFKHATFEDYIASLLQAQNESNDRSI